MFSGADGAFKKLKPEPGSGGGGGGGSGGGSGGSGGGGAGLGGAGSGGAAGGHGGSGGGGGSAGGGGPPTSCPTPARRRCVSEILFFHRVCFLSARSRPCRIGHARLL